MQSSIGLKIKTKSIFKKVNVDIVQQLKEKEMHLDLLEIELEKIVIITS